MENYRCVSGYCIKIATICSKTDDIYMSVLEQIVADDMSVLKQIVAILIQCPEIYL